MTEMSPEVTELQKRVERTEYLLVRAEQRQKTVAALALATLIGGIFFSTRMPVHSQTTGQLAQEVATLQAKLAFLSTNGTDMVISGANLHIVNGTQETGNVNGLGNLIIGYNEKRNDTPDTDMRTGSHNLILGAQNSFSSYGGIVAGRHNTISADFSCVEGGFGNSATGKYADICGGIVNTASGTYSYVGGGEVNTASGESSAISGGLYNMAIARSAAVSGGAGNVASGNYTSIGGGYENTASGGYSYIGGGQANTASGQASCITGGNRNSAFAIDSAVIGGESNTTHGGFSIVLGGKANATTTAFEVQPLSTLTADIAAIDKSVTGINTSIATVNTSLGSINTTLTNDGASITNLQTTVKTDSTEITALQSQVQYISTGTDENGFPATFITKCNLWVQDGSGSTFDNFGKLTGLGNLIIGYNQPEGTANPNGDVRTGSHNLILGDGSSYKSYGGAVFGYGNTSLGAYASVTGGQFNTASGDWTSITGGVSNRAVGVVSSITGGIFNTASGNVSAICGGFNNTIINDPTTTPPNEFSYGAILGGIGNTISAIYGTSP